MDSVTSSNKVSDSYHTLNTTYRTQNHNTGISTVTNCFQASNLQVCAISKGVKGATDCCNHFGKGVEHSVWYTLQIKMAMLLLHNADTNCYTATRLHAWNG